MSSKHPARGSAHRNDVTTFAKPTEWPYVLTRRELLVVGGSGLLAACTGDLDVLGPASPAAWTDGGQLHPIVSGALVAPGNVLDTNNPLANFTNEGGQGFVASPTVLSLNDASITDITNFYASDPAAAPGGAIDIVAAFQIRAASLSLGVYSGVDLVINDGQAQSVRAACVAKDGVKGIGLAGGTAYSDANNYPVFVPVDWSAPTTVRIRRTAQGDGEILDVNGVAPNPRALLASGLLSSRNRVFSTVEFGCNSPEATANAEFTQFYSETPATQIVGVLAFTQFRIRDTNSNDKVRFDADFTLGSGTDGIDPSAELVTVRLSTPAYGQFYPAPTADFNPLSGFDLKGRTPRRRWSLNAAERVRTGIEKLHLDEDPSQAGRIVLNDKNNSPPAIDYSTVNVEILLGNDQLTGVAQLVEHAAGSGRWRLAP